MEENILLKNCNTREKEISKDVDGLVQSFAVLKNA